MMTDPRVLSAPRMSLAADHRGPADPRLGLPGTPTDPRSGLTDRGLLSVCNCGLPNCPRVPHHPGSHTMTLPQEGHLAATHGFPGLPLGAAPIDPALLYQMGAAYGLGENPDMIRSLPQLNGYYPYDPTDVYPYMNGYAGIDARRKNATKESTNTLKAWLFEHRKNPYPTKGEKIMLAILTKMTLTQVSTWFANARRRLKKENKVTWVTKDDDMDDDDDDVNSEHNSDITDQANVSGNSAGGDPKHAHGSLDDDDNFSLISGGDPSEIDVEEHNEIGDEDHRVPPMIPHGVPPMYLSNHGQHTHTSLMTSMGHHIASSRTDQSGQSDSQLHRDGHNDYKFRSSPSNSPRPTSDRKSPSNISPITPPPSPGDVRHSQSQSPSQSSTTHLHQSAATIHHHPVTSPSSVSSRTSASSLTSSSSSPTKPKIWSIADVMCSEDSNKTTSKTEITSPRPHALSHMNGISATSPVMSLGGVPVRPVGLPQGVVVPSADGPHNLAYYPYGLPHPAMMTSQVSHIRIPHPYARGSHMLAGHPSGPHLVTAASNHPMLQYSKLSRPTIQSSQRPGDLQADIRKVEESIRHENSNTQADSRRDAKCTLTAFTPVAHRQV